MFHPTGDQLVTVGIILFILIVLRILYTIPLKISLAAERDEARLCGESEVGFGPFGVVFLYDGALKGETSICGRRLFSFSIPTPGEEDTEPEKEKSEERGILSGMRWIPVIFQGSRRIIRHFRIDMFICHARIGCGDPCTTGMMYGYIQAIIPFLPGEHDICITPDFHDRVLVGHLRLVTLFMYPFALLVYLCRIIIPEVLNRPVTSGGKMDAESG
ncbi:MAG TPA: DUF2953 domain-containing protein [Methanospirillum sp.]|uniref:DUF2953 domain-containing protein n=1 Tax=Methanospirillum sp. TaxID=45200 RepID=UPI002C343EB1|nr:DUF2953 domain-containing protein [Methanospirillum sp.]HOJ97629.1 DUF2953 domain-containing protein [Methanospirillum sp.]HOL40529.1 DUF2953 domain-containing protein [Methanospirillum sp.]HPP78052.1 DUF2953 domain-containing protein [Methanospirillum sp.]